MSQEGHSFLLVHPHQSFRLTNIAEIQQRSSVIWHLWFDKHVYSMDIPFSFSIDSVRRLTEYLNGSDSNIEGGNATEMMDLCIMYGCEMALVQLAAIGRDTQWNLAVFDKLRSRGYQTALIETHLVRCLAGAEYPLLVDSLPFEVMARLLHDGAKTIGSKRIVEIVKASAGKHGRKAGLFLEHVSIGDLDEFDISGLKDFVGGTELHDLFHVQKGKELEMAQTIVRQATDFQAVNNDLEALRSQSNARNLELDAEVGAMNSHLSNALRRIGDLETELAQLLEERRQEEVRQHVHFGINGIFSMIGKELGQNPVDAGAIEITALAPSSEHGGIPTFSTLLEWNQPPVHVGSAAPCAGNFFQFNFKERRVRVVGYAIKTVAYHCPISWKLEGSNTGRDDDWDSIDERSGCPFINTTRMFSCPRSRPYQYIRLISHSETTDKDFYLCMSNFELFDIE